MNALFARLAVCLVALTVTVTVAHAEDIDLFTGSQTSGSLPNVLIILDNTANWNQAFTNEMSALSSTFQNIPVNDDGTARFNLGVMFSAETSSSDNNVSGGYVRAAIRPMTRDNAKTYAKMIASLDKLNDKGNGGVSSLVMTEAFRYFTKAAPIAGNYKAKTDYTGNTGSDWSPSVTSPASLSAMKAIYALPGNALPSKGGSPYNVLPGTGCAKNYIIYISNGAPSDNSNAITAANNYLQQAGGSTATIRLNPAGSMDNPSDEWARFMKSHPIGVSTYTIDVDRKLSGQGPGWTKVLESMALVSEGDYVAVDSATDGGAKISEAINDALSEIQSVNTVFASVSLPVSVNTQGTFLNQVYIGMFRPDPKAAPRWDGNLKHYRMGISGSTLRLEDATGTGAINNQTGFIAECARSYWTPEATDAYWTFRGAAAAGVCVPPVNSDKDLYRWSNSPDGSVVEKGGHAYVLRAQTARNIKTCSKTFANCTSLTNFDKTNADIDATTLGVSSGARDALVDWAYGLDVDDENKDLVTSTLRPSVHGDVVHSRPVALNVGTAAAPSVMVFYGGNDGVFRAINGNRTAAIDTVPAGAELWSFVPPEFFGSLKRLRANEPQIKFPNITAADAKAKDYGLDGSVTAYQSGNDNWVFTTMRRGGRAVYAFNVDKANPSNVTLKWKRGCPSTFAANGTVSDTDCSSGDFSAIGQTWSAPQVVRASNYNGGNKPLLMFGGGYDPCEDADPKTCASGSKGKRVYVLDAETGATQATFTTDAAVIADVAIAPDPVTGLAQYGYVSDLGGNIYRITILDRTPANWTMTKIASLGCDTVATCSGVRKFMFAPDLTKNGTVYSLLIGSGDREKPMLYNGGSSTTNSVRNYFFRVDDSPSDATVLAAEAARCGSAVMCLASLTPILTSANPSQANLAGKKGWYLGLTSAEQVVTSAITIFGNVTFSTHQPTLPDALSCSNDLGITRVYNVQLTDAAPQTAERFEELPEIGLPPSPVAGMVTLEDGKDVAFCIGCSKVSALEAREPPIPLALTPKIPKSRVYWYVED